VVVPFGAKNATIAVTQNAIALVGMRART